MANDGEEPEVQEMVVKHQPEEVVERQQGPCFDRIARMHYNGCNHHNNTTSTVSVCDAYNIRGDFYFAIAYETFFAAYCFELRPRASAAEEVIWRLLRGLP